MTRFAELNREQLRKQAEAGTLVVIPLGATEQHGPHLVTGTDTFSVEAIAVESARIAAASIGVVVAPALPFGSSHHHLIFGGTMSLSTEVYYRVLRDLVESLVTSGFRNIFLLNGHGGNHELAELAARDVAMTRKANVAAGSYWAIAWDALCASGAHQGRRLPGHAGDFETSLVLALRPELALGPLPHRDDPGSSDPRARVAPWRTETHGFWQSINGFTDSPDQASAEAGRRYLEIVTGAVAQAFVATARAWTGAN
jgi:creatinine amidohydrolase